jgi:hypothetical protein
MNGSQQDSDQGGLTETSTACDYNMEGTVKPDSNDQVRVLQGGPQSHVRFASGIELLGGWQPVKVIGVVFLILSGFLGLVEKDLADLFREHTLFQE